MSAYGRGQTGSNGRHQAQSRRPLATALLRALSRALNGRVWLSVQPHQQVRLDTQRVCDAPEHGDTCRDVCSLD